MQNERVREETGRIEARKSVIIFNYGFIYMQGEDEEKQFGTCV